MKRPTKIQNYIDMCNIVKQRSHDAETQAGAILVKNDSGAIVATGCNGFIRGAPDSKLPNTRPDKYPLILHAEDNLIAHCARHGISMLDCTVYLNFNPCVRCIRLLWQCGIKKCIVQSIYEKYWQETQSMPDLKIECGRIGNDCFQITFEGV